LGSIVDAADGSGSPPNKSPEEQTAEAKSDLLLEAAEAREIPRRMRVGWSIVVVVVVLAVVAPTSDFGGGRSSRHPTSTTASAPRLAASRVVGR